ncbi:MAG: amidohydrolase [Clostridia bacterium]|nr:amidohydrolase [Clostridia bacterium]
MYNKFKIIDSHCHIFPDKIARKATDSIDIFYQISETGVINGCGFVGTVKALINQCDAVGVEKCLVTSVATTPHHAQSINSFIASEVELFPDRFIGFGSLHPESEALEEDAEHLIELGLKGVKLHPDIQNFKVDDPKVIRIFEICNEKKLPVLLHTGDSRYDNSNPDRVERILKMFPDLIIIGAHFGGWSIWDKAPEILCKYKNFYVDTCSSFYALSKKRAREIIDLYGADKVIFGTDFPMWKQEEELKFLFDLGLSEEELESILYDNLAKILKI